MEVDLAAILNVAVQLSVLIAAITAAVVWLKRWLRAQIVTPMAEAKRQLEPNGGTQETTRHLIEQTAVSAGEITDKLDELTGMAAENRKIATEALALAQHTASRLDVHLAHPHPTPPVP